MAIQIHGSQQQFTNGSSGTNSAANAFLNAGSRENSQASGSHSKAVSNGGVVYTAGSNQKSSYHHGDGNNINLNQVNSQGNSHGSNQALGSTKNSSNADKKAGAPGAAAPPPTTKVDDTILQERDQLIKYIKQYIKKSNELPPTTLNFYKFVKLIGKGAFGKVTLGVHKLTGKQVAIKTIEKTYM